MVAPSHRTLLSLQFLHAIIDLFRFGFDAALLADEPGNIGPEPVAESGGESGPSMRWSRSMPIVWSLE